MSTPRLSELEGRLLQAPSREHSAARSWTGWLSRYAATSPKRSPLGHRWPPLATSARLRIPGHITIGRWLPFRAHAGCPIDPRPSTRN
jgi:hypothetical protein